MSIDIMADSQTDAVLAILDRGEADASTQQRVSAALLRSQTKMIAALQEIKESLWSVDSLKSIVKAEHDRECSQCPARKYVEHIQQEMACQAKSGKGKQDDQQKWYSFALNPSFQYFILMVILVWAFIYVNTGKEGVDAVKDAATSTMTGGAK